MLDGRKSAAIQKAATSLFSVNSPRACAKHCISIVIGTGLLLACLKAPAQNIEPLTTGEAIFQSRWTNQFPDSEPVEQALGTNAQKTESFDAEQWAGDVARTLQKILHEGPVDIRPSISTGWEYSDRADEGQATTQSDDNSFFVSPAVRLTYSRQVGAWTVNASYFGAAKYYLNPNYTAGGTNGNRNPFTQNATFQTMVEGSRYRLKGGIEAVYGVGYDIDANQNVTRLNMRAYGDVDYALLAFTELGAAGEYRIRSYQGENEGIQESLITKSLVNIHAAQLLSTKSRVRLDLDVGQSTQHIDGGSTRNANRSYIQAAVSGLYAPTPKLRLLFAGGARYVTDPDVRNPKYIGLQPVYLAEVDYLPTQKVTITGKLSLQEVDILPDYRLNLNWKPREETNFTLAIYQNQSFSMTIVDQVQVNTGVIGTASQLLFRKVELGLSGGWQIVDNQSISSSGPGEENANTSYSYGFASTSLIWHIRDWANWSATWWYRTGRNSVGSQPENRISVSLGLTF